MSGDRFPAIGVVLAGGRSRRMGTDKALVRLGNETLLERSVHTLKSVCTHVVIAGGEASRYTMPGIRCLADPMPDAGPLSGLLAALEAVGVGAPGDADPRVDSSVGLGADGGVGPRVDVDASVGANAGAHAGAGIILVLACDLPLVTPSLMKLLLTTEPEQPILITRSSGVTQPLCGRYATSLAPALRAYLSRGERTVHGFVSTCQHAYLAIEHGHPLYHPSLLSNINGTDDLTQAETIMQQRGTAQ